MFGLGWGEMVVIGIVALIAIGPKELPTVLRTIGHWMGKVRRMANEFQGQFQEALREAELTDLQKQAESFTSDITNFDPLAETQKDLERSFDINDPLQTPDQPAADVAVPDGATLPPGTLPPVIDVQLPELPAPVTEKDFAPSEPAPATPPQALDALPTPDQLPKQAGGGA
jgi:sec-independent protein translocase protein TatB